LATFNSGQSAITCPPFTAPPASNAMGRIAIGLLPMVVSTGEAARILWRS